MNGSNNTVSAKTEQDVVTTDLRDLLAVFLLKWKSILILLVAGAILGCGLALLKNSRAEETTEEERIAAAREKLGEDDAVTVEQLFSQYVSYKELQKEKALYYSSFVANEANLADTVQMQAVFYITSKIRDLDTVLAEMALSEEDYQAMRDIAPDKEACAAIYDRVLLTTVYNNEKSGTAGSGTTNSTISNTIKMPAEDGAENADLVNVRLYGLSEEQCRAMMAIVEKAFQRKVEELKALDPEIKLEILGEQFNYNVAEYVDTLRKKNIDSMAVLEKEISDLNTKVNTLTAAEKDYYNLLKQQHNGIITTKENVSLKKWTVIGAFLGAVVAAGVIFLSYVLDGKIKSPVELEQDNKLLNRVFIKGKKNLLGTWAAKLIHADEIDPAVKAEIVAKDIGILMEKNGKNRLLLLCDQEDKDASAFAEQIRSRLQAGNDSLKVDIGDPVHSVEELGMAAQADMGVAVAEMKKSRRAVLREWRKICERYQMPLAGAVAVQRCW